MTMRLDIVTNDAGELVRREHARELGANVVIAIYRLAKLAQVHDLQNQAFTRQLEQTHQVIGDYCLRSGMNVQVLFAHKAVFVAGQLLKGSRGAYEAATELGELLERLGGSELFIERSVTREELVAFAEQISTSMRSAPGGFRSPSPKLRLRRVNDAARLRGLELEDLSPDQRIIRTYASAVVIMRRFYEDLLASRYILPRRIKRIAQSLVDLSEGTTVSFLGVTEVRNANFDEAGRAVNSAILSVSIARELTQDRGVLSQIAMAAMMLDVARPRALALAASGGPAMPGMQGPTSLSEDQEDRLAAGAAAVLTALGRVNEPSITRTVLAFEALWLRRQTWIGPVYWGARSPTLHAKIITIARRYNDLLTPEPGLVPPSPDFAVARLSEELTEQQDRVVLRMLVAALGLLPMGTVVQLSTGEMAEVVRGPKGPLEKPRLRVVMDATGAPIAQAPEIELAQDPHRRVARVISIDGWKKGLGDAPGHAIEQGYDPDAQASDEPEPPLMPAASMPPRGASSPSIADQYAAQYASWSGQLEPAPEEPAPPRRDSSSIQSGSGEHNSLPSMGSSPSAVAEAMGRMINDSLRPPSLTPGVERTLYQPGAPEETPDRASRRVPREPTARGNLSATPLPHVLVYMLDHALTGSVIFEGGPDSGDTIHFVHGVPTKIRLTQPVGQLGELLISAGAIELRALEQAVESARRLGILLGEYLVGHDLCSREIIAWGLEAQVLHKIAHLAHLPPEVEYAFHREHDLLEGWGGADLPTSAPLNPILASVRNWSDRARVRATLNRIGKHALVLHESSDVTRLALLPEEEQVLALIRNEALSVAQLFKRGVADEEIVSSLIYTLAVTRQFSFKGQKKGPMAPGGIARASISHAPQAGASSRPASSAPGQSGSRPSPAVISSVHPPPPLAPPSPVPSPQRARLADTGAHPKVPESGRGLGGAPRPIAPAARPPTASAPQIRLQKKGTIVGLQPASPLSQRVEPGAAAAPRPAAPAPPPSIPADASDEARTIALTSPFQSQLAPKPSGAPRPMPGLPSQSGSPPAMSKRPSIVKSDAPGKQASAGPPRLQGATAGRRSADSTDELVVDPSDQAAADAAADAMTSFRMAEAALQRNDTAAALELAERAAASDPSQHDYAVLVAWIRALPGNPSSMSQSIRALSKVLLEDPSNERALLYRGKLLARTNRLQEAMTDFNELLSTNPLHREAAAEARLLKQKYPQL